VSAGAGTPLCAREELIVEDAVPVLNDAVEEDEGDVGRPKEPVADVDGLGNTRGSTTREAVGVELSLEIELKVVLVELVGLMWGTR
jgi:hypothetical protein